MREKGTAKKANTERERQDKKKKTPHIDGEGHRKAGLRARGEREREGEREGEGGREGMRE